jgi:outer membrane biosynthesis protein TonB
MINASLSRRTCLSGLVVLLLLAGTMVLGKPTCAKEAGAPSAQVEVPDSTEALPFPLVEQKPTFNGGDANEFSKWFNSRFTYPQSLKDAEILEVRIVLQFTVCTDGKVRDIKVVSDSHPDLAAEAIRVISASPDWKPGYNRGKPVNVRYTFPVLFSPRW